MLRFTILIILFLVVLFIEKMIDKFLGVKRNKLSETSGKSVDRWGRTLIIILFLAAYFFALTVESYAIYEWYVVLLFTTLMAFQVILEWKYLRESKQFISTLISSTIIICIFLFFFRFYN